MEEGTQVLKYGFVVVSVRITPQLYSQRRKLKKIMFGRWLGMPRYLASR